MRHINVVNDATKIQKVVSVKFVCQYKIKSQK